MRFLADSHQRDVLRQAGAVYQFRHLELQCGLAIKPRMADLLTGGPPSLPPSRRVFIWGSPAGHLEIRIVFSADQRGRCLK